MIAFRRMVIAIVSLIFAAMLGFSIPAFLVTYFRYQWYPSLMEFDIAGIVYALLAGILGAIPSTMLVSNWLKRC